MEASYAGEAESSSAPNKNEGKVEVKMDKNETKCNKLFQSPYISLGIPLRFLKI